MKNNATVSDEEIEKIMSRNPQPYEHNVIPPMHSILHGERILKNAKVPQAFSDAITNAIENGSGITEVKIDHESGAIQYKSHGEIRIAVDLARAASAAGEKQYGE